VLFYQYVVLILLIVFIFSKKIHIVKIKYTLNKMYCEVLLFYMLFIKQPMSYY